MGPISCGYIVMLLLLLNGLFADFSLSFYHSSIAFICQQSLSGIGFLGKGKRTARRRDLLRGNILGQSMVQHILALGRGSPLCEVYLVLSKNCPWSARTHDWQ